MIVGASPQYRVLIRTGVQGFWVQPEKFVLVLVSENTHQSRVGVEQLPFRRTEINAFLQSFKQLGKTAFLLALLGHITSQCACANNLVSLDDGI